EPGTFHFGVSVQGWSDATSDWVVKPNARRRTWLKSCSTWVLCSCCKTPSFRSFAHLLKAGCACSRRLASICLFRAICWTRSGRKSGRIWAARGAAAALGMRCWKPGSRLDGAGFSGDGFLAMPSDHLRGVERDEPKAQGPCRFLMSRDATRRHHDDTSMHGPIRYTFYQRAHREQEGPMKLPPALLLTGERGHVALVPESGCSFRPTAGWRRVARKSLIGPKGSPDSVTYGML